MKLRIWSALIAVYVVWGSTYLAIRFAVETMPPFLMAALRFFIAGGILFAWRRLAGDAPPTRRQWKSAAIIGLFMLLGGNGCVVWAEQHVVSGIAALLVGAAPLWMALLDAIRPGTKRSGWQTWLGVLWGFAGIALLIGPDELSSAGTHLYLPGVAALLLASFLWSVGSLYSRSACLPDSPLLGTSMEMLAGSTGLLLAGTFAGDWSHLNLAAIRLPSVLGLLYLIFFGSLVGFAAYTWLLRAAPTPLVSTYAYVNPLVAIFIGNLLADEPLTPRILLAAGVIISSVVLINLSKTSTSKIQAPAPAPCLGND
jgi:drug/metabolite transporter (DMT)-like permease